MNMEYRSVLQIIGDEQGWDEQTKLNFCLRFLDEADSHDIVEWRAFLRDIQDTENECIVDADECLRDNDGDAATDMEDRT